MLATNKIQVGNMNYTVSNVCFVSNTLKIGGLGAPRDPLGFGLEYFVEHFLLNVTDG